MTQDERTTAMSPTNGRNGGQAGGSGGTMVQAKAGAGEVASTAQEGVKTVAADAVDQAKHVAGEVKAQVHQLTQQTTQELRQQAEDRSAQAAQGLRSMVDQIQALSDGRPEQAGSLVRYLGDGQHRLQSLADRLDQRGPQGVMDDVAQFARRRPGAFLLYAAGAGFVAGRFIRANQGGTSQTNGSGNGQSAFGAPLRGTSMPSLAAPPAVEFGAQTATGDVWTTEPGTLAPARASTAAMSDPSWSS